MFVWWLHIQCGQSYGCNPYVGDSCTLGWWEMYKMQGTYIKILSNNCIWHAKLPMATYMVWMLVAMEIDIQIIIKSWNCILKIYTLIDLKYNDRNNKKKNLTYAQIKQKILQLFIVFLTFYCAYLCTNEAIMLYVVRILIQRLIIICIRLHWYKHAQYTIRH